MRHRPDTKKGPKQCLLTKLKHYFGWLKFRYATSYLLCSEIHRELSTYILTGRLPNIRRELSKSQSALKWVPGVGDAKRSALVRSGA